MRLFVIHIFALLILILHSDAKHSRESQKHSKNRKRWMESSYSQGFDQAETRSNSNNNNGGFTSMEPSLDQAEVGVSLGLGDNENSDMEIKNDFSAGLSDMKDSSKPSDQSISPDDIYAQDMASYLKPGIGDYPSDMPHESMSKPHARPHHGPRPNESFQQHVDNAYLLEDAISNLSQNADESSQLNNNNNKQKENKNENQANQNPSNSEGGGSGEASNLADQDDVSPTKVIDSALAKITSEASKLIKNNDNKEEHSSSSGEGSGDSNTNHGTKEGDKELSDEAFVLKLAGANSSNNDDKEKPKEKEKENEKLTKEKEAQNKEKESEKMKETEKAKEFETQAKESETQAKESETQAKVSKEKAKETEKENSTETSEKTAEEKPISKIVEAEKPKSETKEEGDNSKNVEGTRRQTYGIYGDSGLKIHEVGLPSLQYNVNLMDVDADLDSTEHVAAKQELPDDVKDQFVSSLKQALLKNVKEIMNSDSRDNDDSPEKEHSDNKDSHKVGEEGALHQELTSSKEKEKGSKSEKIDHDKIDKEEQTSVKFLKEKQNNNKEEKGKDEKVEKIVKNEGGEGGKINDSKKVKTEEAADEHHDENKQEDSDSHAEKDAESEAAAGEGGADMLEANLMKIDKKKLVHLLAKFMRERKKSEKSDSTTTHESSSSINQYGGGISVDTEISPHESGDHYQSHILHQSKPILLQNSQHPKPLPKLLYFHNARNRPDITSDARTADISNYDPYANIGSTDPDDGAKPKSNHHDVKLKKGSTTDDKDTSTQRTDDEQKEHSKASSAEEGIKKLKHDKKGEDTEDHDDSSSDAKNMEQQLEKEKAKLKKLEEENEKEEKQDAAESNRKPAHKVAEHSKGDAAEETSSTLESDKDGDDDKEDSADHKNHHGQKAGMQSDIVDAIANNIDKTIVDQIMQKEKSLENPTDNEDSHFNGDHSTSDEKQSLSTEHLSPSSSGHHTSSDHKQFKESDNDNNKSSPADTSDRNEDSGESEEENNPSSEKNMKKIIHKIKQKLLEKSKLRKLAASKANNDDVYAQIGSSSSNPSLRKRFSRVKKHRIHHVTMGRKRHHQSSKKILTS